MCTLAKNYGRTVVSLPHLSKQNPRFHLKGTPHEEEEGFIASEIVVILHL